MNIFFQKSLRIWVIIIAICLGILITYHFIKPKILEPMGFVNTNNCLKIFYKLNGNTALIYVDPINRWMWFNDGNIYVYGEAPNRYCRNQEEYQPVYVLDVNKRGESKGYQCVKKLDNVKAFYEDGKPWDIILHCFPPETSTRDRVLTVQEIINILLEKRIIFD